MTDTFNLEKDYGLLVDRLHADGKNKRTVILLDGGSGAGKTTLAQKLAKDLAIRLVSLEDFYPGWYGLEAGARMVYESVLNPKVSGFVSWDWYTNKKSDWVSIEPTEPLLVEGCGALTKQSIGYASSAIWYSADWRTRKKQLATRWDAELYRPYWYEWLRQEHSHWQANQPQKLATITVYR